MNTDEMQLLDTYQENMQTNSVLRYRHRTYRMGVLTASMYLRVNHRNT